MRNLQENVFFSTLILGSAFSNYVVFYGDTLLCICIVYGERAKDMLILIAVCVCTLKAIVALQFTVAKYYRMKTFLAFSCLLKVACCELNEGW